jgi:oxalate---CoA ligase
MTSKTPVIAEDHLRAGLLEIWKTLLESNDLTIDDDFFESGGDSLLAGEMVVESERRLGISISDSLLFEASTIRRLAEIFSRSPEVRPKAVYRVSGMTSHHPLFFFHGDWTDGGFYLKDFARSLGPEQPLVAVAPHGMKGEKLPRSLEEMAAQRLPQILDFQPHGPFRLGGHCVGGMVALETARLLMTSGHDVHVVAMLDPIWTGAGRPWPLLERQARVDDVGETQISAGMSRTPEGKLQILPDMDGDPETYEQYGKALERYVPVQLHVPILAFSSMYDGSLWRQVSSDFTLFELPGGGHYDLVTVHLSAVAARVRDQQKRFARDRSPLRPVEQNAAAERVRHGSASWLQRMFRSRPKA